MKSSEKAKLMKLGAFASFSDARKPEAVRLYHALRRACGKSVTGSLVATPNGWRVFKKRTR